MNRNQNNRGRRRLFIILGVIVLAALAVVVGYSLWERPPELVTPTPLPTAGVTATPEVTETPGTETPEPSEPVETDEPAVTETPDPLSQIEEGTAPTVEMTGDRKEGVYTILVAGVDKASGCTDTIMIVSFDTKNHKISATNIPRDTIINIGWYSAPKRINAVYPGAIASGLDPAARLKYELRQMLGFAPDCYAVVNIEVVERVVDTIGGVWFDVPEGIVYEDYVQDLYINIPAGYQLLNGKQAVQICRFRQGNNGTGYARGDLQRIDVQHDVLKAIAAQTLSLGNIPNFPALLEIFTSEVNTDLTTANVAWFARQFLACKSEDITFQTMPIGTSEMVNGVSFVSVAPESWLAMINESINPYVNDVQLYNLNLLVAGGTYAYATNGVIAGGIDSFYCQTCTGRTGKVVWHAPGIHLYNEDGSPVGGGGDTESEGD